MIRFFASYPQDLEQDVTDLAAAGWTVQTVTDLPTGIRIQVEGPEGTPVPAQFAARLERVTSIGKMRPGDKAERI